MLCCVWRKTAALRGLTMITLKAIVFALLVLLVESNVASPNVSAPYRIQPTWTSLTSAVFAGISSFGTHMRIVEHSPLQSSRSIQGSSCIRLSLCYPRHDQRRHNPRPQLGYLLSGRRHRRLAFLQPAERRDIPHRLRPVPSARVGGSGHRGISLVRVHPEPAYAIRGVLFGGMCSYAFLCGAID